MMQVGVRFPFRDANRAEGMAGNGRVLDAAQLGSGGVGGFLGEFLIRSCDSRLNGPRGVLPEPCGDDQQRHRVPCNPEREIAAVNPHPELVPYFLATDAFIGCSCPGGISVTRGSASEPVQW